MIRSLRHRHYQMFTAIGLVLPVVFVGGIVARKPYPTMDALPHTLSVPADTFEVAVWERSGLFAKSPVQVRLWRKSTNQRDLAVSFSADKDYFIKPDLMVYWMAGNPPLTDQLPVQAEWLGQFNSATLPLPAAAAATNGVLVLYSLADQEIVDVSKPIRFDDLAK